MGDGSPDAAAPSVTGLRCNHLVDPLGIDDLAPRLSWVMESSRRGARQSSYEIEVASSVGLLTDGAADIWMTGAVGSSRTLGVCYQGPRLASRQRCYWRVRVHDDAGLLSAWSAPASFEIGLLEPADWLAQWITLDPPLGSPTGGRVAPPHLRTTFTVSGEVRRARAYMSALGIYELHCNGRRVSDDVFRPGWTDYHHRVQYQVYDLTALVHQGANAIGAIVADGWYAGRVGFYENAEQWGSARQLFGQIEVETTDGELMVIPTETSWRGATGPIVAADFQLGEEHDARRELAGWTKADYDDGDWSPTHLGAGPVGRLVASCAEPVRPTEEIVPVSMREHAPGVWIFDLGQNLVGWCRLRVHGPAGTTVTLRHAEMLERDGGLYTENLRGAASIDRYTLSGDGVEVWEPRFTFHGFRYVEVTGYPGQPTLESLTGIVAHSDMATTGTFECSNELVSQLQRNIVWGQRGNFLEVPTDCPQRDERLGWMGDAQVFAPTASFNMDVAAFFTKWVQDVRDAQLDIGAYRDVAPAFPLIPATAAPAWGDAGIIVPWAMYQRYDDERLVHDQLDSMRRWIDYLHVRNPDLIWESARGNDYGDWLSINADTPKDVAATAWWAHSTALLARMARAVGEEQVGEQYAELARGIRQAFCDRFVRPDGTIEGDTQTVYALALRFQLLPETMRAKAVAHLLAAIARCGDHLSTGFMGVAHLLPALSENGELETAYRLLLNETFPSWGYSIRHGATTIWERWDGWTEDGGFQDPGMNSFNHYAYGAVGEWLYEVVGGIGIDPESPGHSRTIIRPRPGGDLTWCKTRYESVRGTIACSWSLEAGGGMRLEVLVPANTEAEVWIPAHDDSVVTEGSTALDEAEGVSAIERRPGAVVCTVGSGSYRFTVSTGG